MEFSIFAHAKSIIASLAIMYGIYLLAVWFFDNRDRENLVKIELKNSTRMIFAKKESAVK